MERDGQSATFLMAVLTHALLVERDRFLLWDGSGHDVLIHAPRMGRDTKNDFCF